MDPTRPTAVPDPLAARSLDEARQAHLRRSLGATVAALAVGIALLLVLLGLAALLG